MSGMYALINDLIVFIQFGGSTRELGHTFVFYKLVSYDVSIPGNGSRIH